MTYSLALGPFHPSWIGPQRIVVRLDGEHVVDLEYRDGYNERNCAERLTRLDLPQALHLVTRICGSCSFAHGLAFCQALEQLCDLAVPERAAYLRCAVAEIERAASHLRGAAATLDALGMERRARTLLGLRESALQILRSYTGARVIPDVCLPGGLRRDLGTREREAALVELPKLNRTLYRLIDGLIDNRALLARTVEVGALPKSAAEQFGVRGPLARASGIERDARHDHPYAAYGQLDVRVITQEGGDLYARLMLLLLEALESLKLVERTLARLPDGPWQGDFPEELPAGEGRSTVEGPRGALHYTLTGNGQRLGSARIETPRQLDRLLVRTLLIGAALDNVSGIIASCDACTSCAEL